MNLFLTSFLVVFPLALKLGLGFFLRKVRIISSQSFKEFNKLTFILFLPILLFNNIYRGDIQNDFKGDLIIFSLISISLIFFLLMFIIPRIEKANPKRGVLIQAVTRSNFILFGIPVAQALYGKEALGQASIMVSVAVPLMNTLSVIALQTFNGKKVKLTKILIEIAKTPIIIAAFSAYVLALTGIRLPEFIEQFIAELASIATPIALIILGGSVTFQHLSSHRRQLLIGMSAKLVIVPLLGVTGAILMGFRNESLVILMALFSSPTAVSSYAMATQMGGDSDLAGLLVVFTTFTSIITIFFITFALLAMHLI
ncbi:MAG: AEC family transporter [Sphaerochaetaceae bacterium]